MGVSAVVVTFNRLELLKECLNCLESQKVSLDKIVIINNNSSDGTTEYLKQIKNENYLVKNLKKNLGGAGGFSEGLKVAMEETDSDLFWIMDDDTMVTENSLEKLINADRLLNRNYGYLCSNVRLWSTNEPANIPEPIDDWTALAKEGLIKVRSATFVSLIIPREKVKEVGLPVSKMFIWGDDTEYTNRLYTDSNCYLVSDSIINHKSKSNGIDENIYNASEKRIKFFMYRKRNKLYIDKKYYSKKRFIIDLISFCVELISIPFLSHNHRLKRFKFQFKGIINGIVFNPKIDFTEEK